MKAKMYRKYRAICWAAVLSCFLWIGGCSFTRPSAGKTVSGVKVKRLVVLGFRPALPEGAKPGVVRDPLSGSVCRAEPVPADAARLMTDMLFDKLVKAGTYELIPPGQAMGIYHTIVVTDEGVGLPPREIAQKVGNSFGADAVMAGCIYRWRERKGSDYASEQSASVAFVLLLVRPSDGAVIWRSRFDKTQRSLFENLLDAGTFMKSGGRWFTAGKLAAMGLDEMLGTLPGASAKKPKKPVENGGREEG